MDLVHEIATLNGGGDAKLLMDIRWSAAQILTVVFQMSDRVIRIDKSDMVSSDFGFDNEEAFACLLRFVSTTLTGQNV